MKKIAFQWRVEIWPIASDMVWTCGGASIDHLDPCRLGQAERAGGDDDVALLQTVRGNFDLAVLLEAGRNGFSGGLVAGDDGDDAVAVLVSDHGFAWDGQDVLVFLGDDPRPHGSSRTQAGVRRQCDD